MIQVEDVPLKTNNNYYYSIICLFKLLGRGRNKDNIAKDGLRKGH